MTYPATPRVTWLAVQLQDVPTDDASWMDDLLTARLAKMRYTKRRSETTMARWAAKQAIARTLGRPFDPPSALASVVVRNAFDGAPEAIVDGHPIDGVIAMTDRADVAVCMVIEDRARIGCDLELVEPRSEAFVRDYFTPHEQGLVGTADDADLMANLIWSAKESALKVLRTGLRRDTRTVEVHLGPVDPEAVWQPLDVLTVEDHRYPGWWMRHGEFVLTCTTEIATAEPDSLIEPHGLNGVEPEHAWMDEKLV